VELFDVDEIASGFDGVRRSERDGLVQWRYRGRLVARQLDDTAVVIRSEFEARSSLLARHPGTFSVPAQFATHMMIVADLAAGEPEAIEEALAAAWQLQRRGSH
jgi:hypothetical protein